VEIAVIQPRERRRGRRRSLDEHGLSKVRIRSGPHASVVNISAGGVLVESERPLLPGIAIDLLLEIGQQQVAVRGRVLRSNVITVFSSVMAYRSAIAFDRQLSWYAGDESGYHVPRAEAWKSHRFRAEATPPTVSRRSEHGG
jgi:hypothetical protein